MATDNTITDTISGTENVGFQYGGAGTLGLLNYSFNTTTLTGTGVYTGTGGTLDFDIEVDPFSGIEQFGSLSVDGEWFYTGGTLGYAQPLAGGGTLTFNYLPLGGTTAVSQTTFSGTLAPEPAPFIGMGLGVAGLLIRRRRR